MKFSDWFWRTFTRLGRDITWRERYARRRGYAYPGHVPPRPMPAPVGPVSLTERAARFQRGMQVVHSLSPDCLQMLKEDGQILAEVAARVKAQPPRPRHWGMFIVAGETIASGQVITLEADASGHYVAWARRKAHHA